MKVILDFKKDRLGIVCTKASLALLWVRLLHQEIVRCCGRCTGSHPAALLAHSCFVWYDTKSLFFCVPIFKVWLVGWLWSTDWSWLFWEKYASLLNHVLTSLKNRPSSCAWCCWHRTQWLCLFLLYILFVLSFYYCIYCLFIIGRFRVTVSLFQSCLAAEESHSEC